VYGWIATRTSIPFGYLVGSVLLGVAAPLYRMAGKAEQAAFADGAGRTDDSASNG
jgi:hypothetical protein